MQNIKQEINHLLLMAKLLAAQHNDPMLCYFINMAIDQNRASSRSVPKIKPETDAA
ncbi:hypothetical protein [Shinella sp.]|uniref:hypothetical protein n=1 Tax=Shinella sp. TaxID=1870904 RepID=UPI003F7224FC